MEFELRDILLQVGLIPLYIFLGTVRHEVAHVIFAQLQGVIVRRMIFWPHWYREWQDPITLDYLYRVIYHPKEGYVFRFGTWVWGDGVQPNVATHLAPYIVAVLCIAFGFVLMPAIMQYNTFHGVIAAIVLFWLSPGLDIVYNLAKWLVKHRGDWERAFPHG